MKGTPWQTGVWLAGLAVMLACGTGEGEHDPTEATEPDPLEVDAAAEVRPADAGREEARADAAMEAETEPGTETVDGVDGEPCTRRCRDRECGPDGCGGLCGMCPDGEACDDGACGRPCETDADCTDRQACAAWPGHTPGDCVDACVPACPEGLGLQAHDGCHCRVQPIESARTPVGPCAISANEFDGHLSFVSHGNGTRLDLRSGLLWTTHGVDDDASAAEAPAVCAEYGLGSLSWRLPTIDEVIGARDANCDGPGQKSTCLEQHGRVVATIAPGDQKAYGIRFSSWPDMVVVDFEDPYSVDVFCVFVDDPSPPIAPAERFLALRDGSLADRVTGLAWAAPFGASATIGPGGSEAACAALGDYWRTPTFKEASTLRHPEAPASDCGYIPSHLALECPNLDIAAGVVDGQDSEEECHAKQILVRMSPGPAGWLDVIGTYYQSVASVLCVRPLADGDGVPSATDNCPGIPNPGQEDHDANGLGAACDPSEFIPPPAEDPCATVWCGVIDLGGWAGWSCSACPEPLVCDAGACVAVTCTSDADCQADANALPGGTVRRCNFATHACELGIDDHAEVLDLMQRVYRGAAVYYSRTDRLTQQADVLPCQFPGNQGVTPIEGTCCNHQGGPDKDNDDLCDADPAAWDEPVWSNLGLHVLEPHAFVYSHSAEGTLGAARFTASAYADQDCDTLQSTFQVIAYLPENEPCRLVAPPLLTAEFEVVDSARLPVHLTPAQQAGFLPQEGLASMNPFYDEVSTNLAAILDGAVAYYEAQPPGACAFPASTYSTPIEGTCCWPQGGPDADHDNLCDPEPASWEDQSWPQLGFGIQTAHAFVYRAEWYPPASALYRAFAFADLDCDTIQSTFVRFARPVEGTEGCDAEVVPGIYIEAETE